jgi:hypothetical protein
MSRRKITIGVAGLLAFVLGFVTALHSAPAVQPMNLNNTAIHGTASASAGSSAFNHVPRIRRVSGAGSMDAAGAADWADSADVAAIDWSAAPGSGSAILY